MTSKQFEIGTKAPWAPEWSQMGHRIIVVTYAQKKRNLI